VKNEGEVFQNTSGIIIECSEEIPCNPCETTCLSGAIKVGLPITSLPRWDPETCTRCGLCIATCPGLAIFLVDSLHSEDKAAVSVPHEYSPLPAEGSQVNAVDREGKVVCTASVLKVRNPKSHDHTPVVTIAVPKQYSNEVRGIQTISREVDSHE
jgi:Fe-S-cluster-containing hydrogenase component 2